MPPHQIDLTAETASHAPVLGASLPIAQDAPVASRPDVIVAALADAASEKDAAGPPASPTWLIIRVIVHCWRAFHAWRWRESLRASFHDMSERELTDIGITRGEIDCIVAHRDLEQLKDRALTMSRGVM
ncbi:DUF1127 domain-containing protein [Bradyrhizobium sp. STM 3809]|uniref:DUF1127 domain-containing protein n=1 Tax=Bradyrhizobium sp. STM 3809 TaxID=551936 RepID=UPI000240A294|nr:DUF1127 domain-containing protein [Bradyrhizobium sp. STM 3809]CCE02215.1 conserved hypothetical protein [Bradyrhizobium sp. STM 3809]